MLEDRLKAAIRELRERLGTTGKPISQTEMAKRLDRMLGSVQRYEDDGRVPIDVLQLYFRIAVDSGQHDLAELFVLALTEMLGEGTMEMLEWVAKRKKRQPAASPIPDGYIYVAWPLREIIVEIIDMLRNPRTEIEATCGHLLESLVKSRDPQKNSPELNFIAKTNS